MNLDKIAKFDAYLKSRNGYKNLFYIEDLFVTGKSQEQKDKLKEAVEQLLLVRNQLPDSLIDEWRNMMVKQVKISVERVKEDNNYPEENIKDDNVE